MASLKTSDVRIKREPVFFLKGNSTLCSLSWNIEKPVPSVGQFINSDQIEHGSLSSGNVLKVFTGDSLAFIKWVLLSMGYSDDFKNLNKKDPNAVLNHVFYNFLHEVSKVSFEYGCEFESKFPRTNPK